MKRKAQSLDPGQPGADTRLTFDQHVRQLSTMRQSAHQLVIWLVIGAIIVTFGALIFAVYQSIIWKTVGETDVMQAWMYFFLTGAFAAALLGFDTLIVGATIASSFAVARPLALCAPQLSPARKSPSGTCRRLCHSRW